MGGSSWDSEDYSARVTHRATTSTPTFKYDSDVRSGKASGVNPKLDPTKMKNGVRECRDSNAHPISVPIALALDVTGSMSSVPSIIQKKLPQLMGLLIRKGYIDHPAICMSAVGDAYCDNYPFQVGQFESGIELDDDITNIILEGGGGGNLTESYDIFLYYLARCVKADHFEKRNSKGYAFVICDESLSKTINAKQISRIFGTTVQADLSTKDIIQEALTKWNIFCIVPNMTNHYHSDSMKKFWKEMLGQNVIMLDDPENIVELIAATIGSHEGSDVDSIINDLLEVGLTTKEANNISKAIAVYDNVNTKGTGLTTL